MRYKVSDMDSNIAISNSRSPLLDSQYECLLNFLMKMHAFLMDKSDVDKHDDKSQQYSFMIKILTA